MAENMNKCAYIAEPAVRDKSKIKTTQKLGQSNDDYEFEGLWSLRTTRIDGCATMTEV